MTNDAAAGNPRPDPWHALRAHTGARIALGRAGGSLPTAELLRFALDHAEARDAVQAALDLDALEASLAGLNLPIIRVETLAGDRTTYLRRPDLGRMLDAASRARLKSIASVASPQARDVGASRPDVALIVADGLSAMAAQMYAAPVLATLVPLIAKAGLCIAPLVLACQARVALQDDVALALGARSSIILLGERPGLHAPISLGAYLVYKPTIGTTDERRNCVSSIRGNGLTPDAAAQTLQYLLTEVLSRRISGVQVKDQRRLPGPAAEPRGRLL